MNPFLSVIIPCYNSGELLSKGLQSIVDCKMPDIEVIIADDCSTQNYSEIVNRYEDVLNIIQCKTEHNSGNPTNGRELGASLATGTYLSFMDHDDSLSPEGIVEFRKYVEENDYPEYIVTGIRQVDTEGNTEIEKFGILPFLHGKFFHREKFYLKCDLHHKKDIKYQEDNYFTALIACNLIKYNMQPQFTDFCTYCWTAHGESLGHRMRELRLNDSSINREMVETNVMIAEEIMFKFFDEGSLPLEVATEWFLREVASMYFDSQIYYKYYKDYLTLVEPLISGVKERLKVNNDELMQLLVSENGRILQDELNNVLMFEENGVQANTRIEEFLQSVSPD